MAKITEEDLTIYPPHIWSFLCATLLLLVSHASAGILTLYYALRMPSLVLMIVLIISGMFIVFFNIAVIRGHRWGVTGLKAVSVAHAIGAFSSMISIFEEADILVIAISLITPLAALAILFSSYYGSFSTCLEKRWNLYRQTGKTILELYSEQQKQQ